MKQASFHSTRGNWLDSLKANFFPRDTSTSHRSPFLTLRGQAKYMTAPSWTKILRTDTIYGRAIPFIAIFFLILLVLSRLGTSLATSHEIEASAKYNLRLTSELITQRIVKASIIEKQRFGQTLNEFHLQNALNTEIKKELSSIYLVDEKSKIIASYPTDPALTGKHLDYVTGGKKFPLVEGKPQSSIMHIATEGAEDINAIFHTIKLVEESTAIGGLLIMQAPSNTFQAWTKNLWYDFAFFIFICTFLAVVLPVLFNQVSRVRKANQIFLETNTRFDAALARGHCGLWDWDLSRGQIVWSRSMYQLLGMEPTGNIMGFGDLNHLLHPQDPDLLSLTNQVFQSDQRQIDHRFRMMHSSGSWVWMRIRAELVHYKGGAPHLIGIAVDISEQEALKQKTHDADVRLRDAIENISEAFVLWDSKKRLVMCNSKYQQLYNLSDDAVQNGAKHKDVMLKSRKPRARQQIKTDKKLENGTQTFEAQIEDGRWLQISERRTQDGGFVSVGTDITQIKRNHAQLVESERKQMETIKDLRKTQKELEEQAQKLVEFADNLNEEKMRADAGNKSKSEFLANISHELRTPLNAIIGFSDIMRSEMFGPLGSDKYYEYTDDIHSSGNFLLGVINDVLDMSKIEAGRFSIAPEPLFMNDILEETLRIIQVQAEQSGLELNHKIPAKLELEADRRAIKQILLNILSNAVKFTPKGGHIDVSADISSTCVTMIIKDNGIGIPPESLERLGQPFEQVQDQFTKDHKGTGLGLAIARSLTNLHGGDLEITSRLDEGTTVSVRLPIICAASNKVENNETVAA